MIIDITPKEKTYIMLGLNCSLTSLHNAAATTNKNSPAYQNFQERIKEITELQDKIMGEYDANR